MTTPSKLFIILSALVFSSLHGAYATTILSKEDFIASALKNHPLIRTNAANYWNIAQKSKAATGVEDWNLFTNYSITKGNISQGFIGYSDQTTFQSGSIGVNKEFTSSGTQLQLATQFNSLNSPPQIFPGFQTGNISQWSVDISLKQPLLKNASGLLSKLPITLGEIEEKIAKIKYKEDLEDFITQLHLSYLKWQKADQSLTLSKEQLKKADLQLTLVERLKRSGIAEQLEVHQAEQYVIQNQINTALLQTQYEQLTAEIVSLYTGTPLKTPPSQIKPETDTDRYPLPALNDAQIKLKTDSHIEGLLNLNKELQTQLYTQTQENQKMQLNLFGKASLNSQESELGQAFSTIGSKNIYTLGIEGSFPLEGRRENGLKNAQLESVNAAKASYDASLLQLSTWLDQKYLELNTLSFQIKANEENIKLSEKIALFEEKKFSQGRSPSQQFVLQAHNQVLSAKLQQLTLIHLRKITTLQIYAVLDLFQPKISEIIK